MVSMVKKSIHALADVFGYRIIRVSPEKGIEQTIPKDMEDGFLEIYERCHMYSMTSIERMYALYQAVKYIVSSKIPGDFVECGVWKGGSSMMMAATLLQCGETKRKIYLYDTFAGMSDPTEKDKLSSTGCPAADIYKKDTNILAFAPLDEVKSNMLSVDYPEEKIIFVQGKVEDTIPGTVPPAISLLRLDTDWYESTYHEMNNLYPLVSENGVIIIDDYGHWTGAKEATDRYFSEHKISMLMNRIDYTGRLGIKKTT